MNTETNVPVRTIIPGIGDPETSQPIRLDGQVVGMYLNADDALEIIRLLHEYDKQLATLDTTDASHYTSCHFMRHTFTRGNVTSKIDLLGACLQ